MFNLLLIVVGIFLIIFSPKESIYCQRNTVNTGYCMVENSSFFRSEVREIPLENIQEANFKFNQQNNQGKKGNNSADIEELKSQVVLVVKGRDNQKRYLSVNEDFNQHDKSQALQKKISSFLNDASQDKLENINQNNRQWITVGFISLFTAAYAMSRKK